MELRIAQVPPERFITPAVASFLASCDEFRYDRSVLTAGTSIIRGRLIIRVGDAYMATDPITQSEILQHECAHLVSNHFGRQGERDMIAWNIVTDCAIHHCGAANPEVLTANISMVKGFENFRAMTFDMLRGRDGCQIRPMPPEMAYELLPIIHCQGEGCGHESHESCGSMESFQSDGTAESNAKRAITAAQALGADKDFRDAIMARGAGTNTGASRETPELPPAPKWIRRTIEFLVRTQERTHRQRSWRRENRAFQNLPGQSRSFGRGALFMIDASGSIGTERLALFLSAVTKTPELRGSLAVIFDCKYSSYLPVTDVGAIIEALKTYGGGT